MTDKIRELVRNTVNAEIINAICDVIDANKKEMDEREKRVKIIEDHLKKKGAEAHLTRRD